MTPAIATIHEEAEIHEALEIMRANGVRRLVVVASDGALRGILFDRRRGRRPVGRPRRAPAAVLKGEVRRDAAGLGEVKVGG